VVVAALALVPAVAQAAFPGLNGKIAWERGGQILIKDAGASNEQQLTFDGGTDPAWSPDGTRIAFQADRNGTANDIWVMNADGSGQTRLTTGPTNETDAAWSADGTRIVFAGIGDATPKLVVMNANGSAQTPLTGNDNINSAPAFSPDGGRIAWRHFTGGTGISLMNADGTGAAPVVSDASRPNWFPDGSRIAIDRGSGADVWSMAPDGSGLTRLTDDPASDYGAAVSPDGRLIAFSSFRDMNFELYVMEADGGIEIRNTFTAGGISDNDPDWQPLGPPPDITGLSRPVAGSPGADLVVDGTGYVRRSVVRWNGVDRATTYVSPTRLIARLAPVDVAAQGTGQVAVFTSPAGGGLSLGATATIDPPAAPPPAPALAIVRSRFTAKWSRSRVSGTVRLTGAAQRGGRVEVALLRGTGVRQRVVLRKTFTLAAGPFTRTVKLTPTVPPGPLRLRLREVGAVTGARLSPATRVVTLAPPREGVVARTFVSAIQGGPAVRSLRARARVFAHFAFSARPARGRRITVRWTRGGVPAGGAVRKAFAPTVVAFIGASGRLPPGLYRAELRAGARVVAVATVRLT